MFLTASTPIESVVSSMTSSFTTQVGEITTGIGAIVPTLLPVVGVMAIVFIGIRLFKRITGGR